VAPPAKKDGVEVLGDIAEGVGHPSRFHIHLLRVPRRKGWTRRLPA
jgi:hypothetical protein